MSLARIYNVTTEPVVGGELPVIDFKEWVDSPVDESTQMGWMDRWRSAVGDDHDPCIFCEDAEDRYYLDTLPFDVCNTCFNRKVIELRGYLDNPSNRGESGKFDCERLFNTLFPGDMA